MIRVGVIGCEGRVNSHLVDRLKSSIKDFKLSGVLVREIKDAYNFEVFTNIDDLAAKSDAIIDFTNPDTCLDILKKISNKKILFVSGTTGFSESQFRELKSYSSLVPIIWSANMSIGINLLLSFVNKISPILKENFEASIIETHHKHKKDSPSGTAKLIAEAIRDGGISEIQLASLRIGESKGKHTVSFCSNNEELSISHDVFSRETFVDGALAACKWGFNKKPGFYNMQDVFCV